MTPRSSRRQWTGAAAILSVGALAAGLVIGREADPSAPVASASIAKPDRGARPPQKQSPDLDLALLERPLSREIEEHLFSVPALAPPPIPSAVQPRSSDRVDGTDSVPEKPVAPPLPFRFLGRITDSGTTTVFLAYRGQNLGVKKGDEVEKLYRIDQVAEDRLVFVYLPLDERQTLEIGGRR